VGGTHQNQIVCKTAIRRSNHIDGRDLNGKHSWTSAGGSARIHLKMQITFTPGQLVRVNLAGMQVEGVMFQAAVTDAVGNIIKQTSVDPPKYLVRLLFSFRGISEVEVPTDRIYGG
jgi:hypothetical protein